MDFRLVARMLSRITFLIAVTMIFSLPWAFPALSSTPEFEQRGFLALLGSLLISCLIGTLLHILGRSGEGQLFRKEAMAIVGFSWILATFLGALPYALSGTSIKQKVVIAPATDGNTPPQIRYVAKPMSPADWLFESQSGFSTTGASVLGELEDPRYVPRCILFWRSSTHFLGGLGIIVLFVAVLGQGSAGKQLMRSEMPGPSKEGSQARMQHTAWVFAGIYLGLNVLLTVILTMLGIPWFDSLCHAFGTMATGGFSTFNNSVGAFAGIIGQVRAVWAEMVIILFMILAGTNFTLLYFLLLRQPGRLLVDVEWRTYMLIIVVVTALIVLFGYLHGDRLFYYQGDVWGSLTSGLRQGLFQVVSVLTTTGYSSAADFDHWNSFGRGVLFLLMFVGGCAGSTGGGMKVIRHILFLKVIDLELEKAYHPSVVRPLRLAGHPVEEQDMRKNILLYFGLILVIFVFSWMFLVTVEPDSTWARGGTGPQSIDHKLIDCATGIASTLNNIGPGLGTIGSKQNYSHFSWPAKLLFTFLMMVGRLEVFTILVLLMPGFWRAR
ncbi:MAG: TrkH family potassium uptake protein [Pirellulales bacterium]|nr:TrkH family potassium uptake protein [Pirellulales bacterium]